MTTTTTRKKAPSKKAAAPARRPVKKAAPKTAINSIAAIPEMSYADTYIGRKFGKATDFEIMEYALANLRNVLIEGPTGPGKTSAVLAFAAKSKRRFYAIPSNVGIEPSQLFGKYIPDTVGGFVWQDGPVTDIIRHGGVLLINEVNFMPERVATVLFGLLDKRREIVLLDHKGERVRAHRGEECWCGAKTCYDKVVLVCADMNPDYEGTRPLNKAFRNRFSVQLWWDYNEDVEQELVTSMSLIQMASAIRSECAKGTFGAPVSTNMLQEFEEAYYAFGIDFARMNFVNHFAIDERSAIGGVLDTWQANIEADLIDTEEEDLEAGVNDDDAAAQDNDEDDDFSAAEEFAYEEDN